jgi:hypothetical protein
MPPEPHGAAAAGRQRGESADGRARRAWVDRDGSRSATLGELLTVKKVRGYGYRRELPSHTGFVESIALEERQRSQ